MDSQVPSVSPTSEHPRKVTLNYPKQWDLESVYPSEAKWREAVREVRSRAEELVAKKDTLLSSAASLYHYLLEADAILELLGMVTTYADLRFYSNTRDPNFTSLRAEGVGVRSQVTELFSFISPVLLAAPKETISKFLGEHEALRNHYGFYFNELERGRPHTLSEKEEELLGKFSAVLPVAERIREALHDGDMRFTPIVVDGIQHEISHGTIDGLFQNENREVRKAAFESYWKEYGNYSQTFCATLSAQSVLSAVNAEAHNYDSTLSESLFGDELPKSVYTTVIGMCREHYPLFHRYFKAKGKLLGISDFAEFDIFAKLSRSAPAVPYEIGVELTLAALTPLGEKYVEIARQGVCSDHWIDAFPAPGKYSNAFSSGTSGTKPYLLLNYGPNMTEVGTLAHELGHSMHTYLTCRSQPFVYHAYAMSVAETASNLNQVLLREHVLASCDRETALSVLEEAFFFAHRYLFMMPTLSRVEHLLHCKAGRKKGVNSEELQGYTTKAFAAAYGDAVAYDPQYTGVKWGAFCHFYMPYYLFQYAIGISAAMSIGQRLLAGEKGLQEKYLRFLSVGSSMPVLEIFKIVDLDITSPEMYRSAFKVVEGYVRRLEKEAGVAM